LGTLGTAALSRKFVNFNAELKSPNDCLVLVILGVFVVSLVSAIFAALGQFIHGTDLALQREHLQILGEWWMAHAMGVLVLAPALLTAKAGKVSFSARYRALELCVLAVLVLGISLVVFSGLTPLGVKNYPLAFLPFPLLIWAALRFGYRGAAPVTLAFGIIAIAGTRSGYGPFVQGSLFEEVLLFWSYLAVASVTGIYVSAVRAENQAIQKSQKRLIADLDAFTQNVAHDLKDRLNSIVAAADILETANAALSSKEKQEYRGMLHQGGKSMLKHVDDMLVFANVEKNNVRARPLDMHVVVDEALFGLAGSIQEADPEIEFPEVWPRAIGHAPWVVFVWSSFIGNAFKYGGREVKITFGARLDDDNPGQVLFWISDNGPGIKPEDCGNLFQPFSRLNRTACDGSGIGLSIAARITEQLGGRIGVASTGIPGEGATFSFSLPAA
jgi:signal transduction histidine kinase